MKNFSLIFIIVSLLFGCSAGKTKDSAARSAEVSFGVKGGANFASIGGDDAESFGSLTSFHFGGIAEIGISDDFAIQPELLYSEQGADYSESSFSGDYKLSYLNVPVLAKVNVAEGFSLEAGPQVGILLSAKDKYDSGGDSFEEDVKDQTKGIGFDASVGAAYKLDSGLNFGARYNLGLSRLDDFSSEGSNTKWKNNVFQIYFGYIFN